MVNWKAADYAAGFFSVLVFIITTIIYIMFLMSQRETVAAIGNAWDKINTNAQSEIQRMNNNVYGTTNDEKEKEQVNTSTPQKMNNEHEQEQVETTAPQSMTGGKMSGKMIGATILELLALGFSAIIWGITFGQATTGYSN